MICIWSLALWLSQGRPQRVRLVELGPGRGTLMADVLRAAKGSFPAFAAAVRDVRLVELSPALRAAQWRTLQCESLDGGALKEAGQAPPSPPPTRGVSRLLGDDGDGGDGSTATTRRGVPVTWHASLDEVPGRVRVKEGTAEGGQPEFVVENDDDDDVEEEEGVGAEAAATAATTKTPKPPFATIYIAHEFFDALPVHQFQYAPARGGGGGRRKGGGVTSSTSGDSDSARLVGSGGARDGGDNQQQGGCWLERMVDIVPEDEPPYKDGLHLRFVLSPSPTPASALLVQRRLAALTAEQRAALASSSSSSSSPPSPGASSSPPQPSAIEISAHGMAVAEALALRVGFSGGGASSQGGSSSSNNSGDGDKSAPSTPAPPPRAGAALILDYGRGAPYSGSLTAVRAHAQHPHPLSLPGAADLSAWVDFSALEQAARESGAPVSVHGPVEQGAFLGALGARARAEALAVAAADGAAESAASRGQGQQGMEREARRAAEAVAAAYRRLVGGGQEGMGETYKAFAIVPRVRGVVAEGGEGGGGTATATAPVGFGGGVADAASL
jgi:NADH dehydrogenase [ubiquinone] 1 alpha subcomplex assembly factor 7